MPNGSSEGGRVTEPAAAIRVALCALTQQTGWWCHAEAEAPHYAWLLRNPRRGRKSVPIGREYRGADDRRQHRAADR